MTESQGATANSKSPAGSRKLAGSKFRAELPDQGPNYRKILRENRRLMDKATQNPTQFAAFPIRDSLG